MPNFPIIDAHVHVWDQTRLRYSAFDGHPIWDRPFHIEDYVRDLGDVEVEAMVFLECYADFWEGGGQYLEEIAFVEDEARREPRLKAIVAAVPAEWGAARLRPLLEKMRDEHPMVRGVRRIMEFDPDPRALTLSEEFISSVNLLEEFGWTFDINPNYTQMDIIREFVTHIPNVPMILDHCGKPGQKQGALAQYRDDIHALAKHPNMWVKLSDLPAYAVENWTEADLRPYIEATLDAFGPERTIYAGDYPICLQATTLPRWVEVLDNAFSDLGLSETEQRLIYRDNANAFYRLGL